MTNEATDELDLWDAFAEASALENGPGRVLALQQVAKRAAAEEDARLEYVARLRLIEAGVFGHDIEAAMVAFAWCVGRYDADPEGFPAAPLWDVDLLWFNKWMAPRLADHPAFSLETIEAALTDMEDRYVRAGEGLHGVLTTRLLTALKIGRLDMVDTLLPELVATPRDGRSDCEACVIGGRVGALVALGRTSEAIELVKTAISRGQTCAEEPQEAAATALLPALASGDTAAAADFATYAARRSQVKDRALVVHAALFAFAAVSDNLTRAWFELELCLQWLGQDAFDVDETFRATQDLATGVEALVALGHGAVEVAVTPGLRRTVPGAADEQVSLEDLAAALWATVERRAAEFDDRNGNDWSSRGVASARARAGLRAHVDVSWPRQPRRRSRA